MKKIYLKSVGLALIMSVLCCFDASAKWEQIRAQKASYAMHITENGTMLLADYLYNGTGGIYCSEDQGVTWTKTNAPDYCYEEFVEAGEYIIALGGSARLARSNDNGKTWEILNYSSFVPTELAPTWEADYTVCYAATMHNGKLFIGDFTGAGILYSEDFGETWQMTDLVSLQYEIEGKDGKPSVGTENIYNLVSYKGNLYAFGMLFIYQYDEANNKWITLRNDSNFMAISAFYGDNLVCGRSVMNQDLNDSFIEIFDGTSWTWMNRPEGLIDNNIRTMCADGETLYVGMQQTGFYYTYNGGESWAQMSEGLPLQFDDTPGFYLTLLSLQTHGDYVYMLIYDTPFTQRGDVSGVYRISKQELLENASVADLLENKNDIYVDGSYIYTGECEAVYVSDLSGKNVPVTVVDGKADISSLEQGVYVYRVVSAGKSVAGKFMKK